jgi:hypothetical protein
MGMLEDIPKIARQWPWTRGSGGRWQHLRRWVLLARLRRAGEEFPHLSNWGFPSWRQLGTVPDGMCVVGPRLARESHLLPAVPAGFPSARPAGCGGGPIRKFPALRRVWPGRRRRAARLSPVMRATGLTGRLRSCAGCYPLPSPALQQLRRRINPAQGVVVSPFGSAPPRCFLRRGLRPAALSDAARRAFRRDSAGPEGDKRMTPIF